MPFPIQQAEAIIDVFWLGQPELYFESVQLLFMVISFYFALWFTVMVSAAPTNYWKALSIAPAIVILVFFFYIVKTAALLRAMYTVDTDALLEVLEETEATLQLSEELRCKVVEQVSLSADEAIEEESAGEVAYRELERLYKTIDINGNNSLSRSEFGEFMLLMDISFSRKKWERIFKEIDRNYDNQISLQEFFLFLYPDHDLALTLEMRRLKVISRRVTKRANYFLSHLSPFRDITGERNAHIYIPGMAAVRSFRNNIPSSLREPGMPCEDLDGETAQERADAMAKLAADGVVF